MLNKIESVIKQHQDKKLAVSGYHYFIKGDDGAIELYKRVHAMIGGLTQGSKAWNDW